MKLTFNWLKEFVDFIGTPQELAALLTMAGLEVESLSALRDPETNREDWLLEISVTPNRGDCLGVVGIAHEVAALSGAELKSVATVAFDSDSQTDHQCAIRIDDPTLCARYSARIVDRLTMSQSPGWLRYRLEACGIRSINHVVDVTNYVMLETGQPLHAFDCDRLPNKSIIVRRARETQKFTTLDGVQRELAGEDLLVCAGESPVALAGIMGGAETEVNALTSSILLESANFHPSSIRRTAKRLGLHSEASHRFERGVDPDGTVAALERAVWLIKEIDAGSELGSGADKYPGRTKPVSIRVRQKRIEHLLGAPIELEHAEKLFGALGLQVERLPRSRSLKVGVPRRRADLTREADLIEELARVNGYDKIPTSLPLFRVSAKDNSRLVCERRLRALLSGEGLTEVINLPFTSEITNQCFVGLWNRQASAVAVLNPLAKENGELRHSVLPGLIDNMRVNLSREARSFHAFQIGKVFRLTSAGESEEKLCLGGLLYGPRPSCGLRVHESPIAGFLECKGLVQAVLDLFRLDAAVNWSAGTMAFLHPGKSAGFGYHGDDLGYLGELHPEVAERLDIPRVLVFELDFDKLLQYAPRRIAAKPLPRFPAVERDVAIVVDRDFAAQKVIGWIHDLGEPLIEHAEVFDQYVGAPVPDGKKSLAYRVSYRAEDKTLTDSEINELHQKLVDRLGQTFGAERRS